jgi:hypothetical protein
MESYKGFGDGELKLVGMPVVIMPCFEAGSKLWCLQSTVVMTAAVHAACSGRPKGAVKGGSLDLPMVEMPTVLPQHPTSWPALAVCNGW